MLKIFLFFLLIGIESAYAQEPPPITLPAQDVQHIIVLLRNGGTRMEADALAQKVTDEAQADLVRQKAAAAKTEAPKPPDKP